jgi:putative glutamine amidotransferase
MLDDGRARLVIHNRRDTHSILGAKRDPIRRDSVDWRKPSIHSFIQFWCMKLKSEQNETEKAHPSFIAQNEEMSKRVLIPFRNPQKVIPYAAAARAGGAEPTTSSVDEKLSLQGFDGLLLTGGTDVNPSRFGAQPQPETDAPDDPRDEAELALIREAIERDIPILAICRGLQILNVFHGGTLVQHIVGHDPEKEDTSAVAHEVVFEPASKLSRIASDVKWGVNSRHHQAVSKVGDHLYISARDAKDGVVEGLERRDKRFVVAVQWHPEDQVRAHPEQLRLFESFAAAL